jgi:hypothetical protein
MKIENEEFFRDIFAQAVAKTPDGTAHQEEKRLAAYCLMLMKEGHHDKEVCCNMAGYDLNLPSTVSSKGEILSKKKLFDRVWIKAVVETRKRVMFACLKHIFGKDFKPYKKTHSMLCAYSDACERESTDVKFVPSKALAKKLGVPSGEVARISKANFEKLLHDKTGGQDFVGKGKEFGAQYRTSLSKFAVMRNERIEMTYGDDDEIGEGDYI